MTFQPESTRLQDAIWDGSVPLDIRLSPQECRVYDKSDPYLVSLSDSTVILQGLKCGLSDPVPSTILSSVPPITTTRFLHTLPDRH